MNSGRETAEADVIEAFLDAADAATPTDLTAKATAELAATGRVTGLSVELSETTASAYGKTFVVGDTLRLGVAGIEVTDVLREATLTFTAEDGPRVSPTIGDPLAGTPEKALTKNLAAIAAGVRKTEDEVGGPVTEESFPWIGGGAVDAGGWRGLHAGMWADGVTNQIDGTVFAVSVTGSDKVVTVAAGTANVQGAGYESDAAVNHNIGAVGSAPTGSQYRWDYIVLRYDASQAIADRVKQAIKPGTPSTAPSFPALTQDPDGIWEVPIIEVKRGPGNVNLTSGMVSRCMVHAAQTVYVNVSATLPSGLNDAGIAFTGDNIYRQSRTNGYQSILDPPFTNFTYASGIVADVIPFKWRWTRGGVQVSGSFRKSSGTFPVGWVTIASVPLSWWTNGINRPATAGPLQAGKPGPAFPIVLNRLPIEGVTGPPIPGGIQFTINSSGGFVSVYASAASATFCTAVDLWIPGIDPRLA